MIYDLIVVGGGAAGYFAAINAADLNPKLKVLIIEKNAKSLQKVKVSGGGRCNVTHACFEPVELIKNYPRGNKELLEPFKRFGPQETITWFEKRGVPIVKEVDGRMFPKSNTSQSIIDCFEKECKRLGIQKQMQLSLKGFKYLNNVWDLELSNQSTLRAKNLMIATGSDKHIWDMLMELDFEIASPVPSLFTFKIKDTDLAELAGTSFVEITAFAGEIKSVGPGLITHWGLSGPAILKLSAFAALELNKKEYQFKVKIDWLPTVTKDSMIETFRNNQTANGKKKISANPEFGFSIRFWKYLCLKSNVGEFQNWSESGKKTWQTLAKNIKAHDYQVDGKSTFKDEFVTAGGVALSEIDMATFSSHKYPSLFFAGEVLNIDAITGGFNFQAAWTGAWHVAKQVSETSHYH